MRRILSLALLFAGALRADTALVLSFFNHATSANLDWVGESIAQSVRDSLASEGILVLDREDRLEAYRRLSLRPGAELTHASILKIGESLDASQVVYGYYELLPAEPGNVQSKGSLRITARILDLKHTRQGGVYSELGALEDLGSLATHLGWQTLEWLNPQGAPGEREFMNARPAVRLDAVESYVRGLLSTPPEQPHRYFTQAARLDEHYSQPCFQLGKSFWEKKDYKVAAGWLARVARSDPHYLEAQFFLGLSRFANGDFTEGSADHPGLAGVGSEIVTSFRIFPWLPWRAEWVAQVVGFEWNHHFADVQKKGPFKSFHHRHEFAAVRRNGVNGTIVRDVIRYEVGFGICGKWAQNLLLIRKLKQTFEYRQMTLEKLLAQESQPG